MTNTARYNGGYTYFYGQVAPNETLSRDNSEHKIIVFAAAKNMPSQDLLYDVAQQEYEIQITKERLPNERKFLNDIEFSTNQTPPQYTDGKTMYGDGYYFAMRTVSVKTASKIFDFKITDCSDVAYKSVFRKTNTNELANNSSYY